MLVTGGISLIKQSNTCLKKIYVKMFIGSQERKKERKKDENDSFETLFTKILPLLLPINWFLIAQFQISLKLMLFYNVMIGNLKHVIDY